ncbi:MAG: molybdenum cofactor guanylyltransferase [Betaproteobacteria bacterium]
MMADCLAVVMAGGESQRMGCDKASLKLGERTLLQRVIDVVEPLFGELRVSVRHPRPDIDWPQICDRHADAGPLAGVCAALEWAKERQVPWIFVVATDMPFIRPALIESLAQRRSGWQAVIPVVHGHPQPLAGFYSTDALAAIQAVLAGAGKHSLRAALELMQVNEVDAAELLAVDPELESFFDLDTPQDVEVAKRFKES